MKQQTYIDKNYLLFDRGVVDGDVTRCDVTILVDESISASVSGGFGGKTHDDPFGKTEINGFAYLSKVYIDD